MLTVLFFSFFSFIFSSHAQDIHLSTGEYLPYTSEHAENYGFFSEIVTRVIKKMDMNPVYSFYPWKRGQENLREGKEWATFPYVKNPEREQEFWFTAQPLFTSNIKFFYCKDYLPHGIQWNSLEDLKSYSIGGIRDYWYEADFAKAGLNVEYTIHMEQTLKKLQAGRIKLFPVADVVGWYLIEKFFPNLKNRFGTLEKPYDIVHTHLMVSKSYPNSRHLLKQFDETFQKMRKTGEYQTILKKYAMEE